MGWETFCRVPGTGGPGARTARFFIADRMMRLPSLAPVQEFPKGAVSSKSNLGGWNQIGRVQLDRILEASLSTIHLCLGVSRRKLCQFFLHRRKLGT